MEAPPIPAKDWIAAQKLVVKGWQNLGYKVTIHGKEVMIFPSEKLLDSIPEASKTVGGPS